MSSPSAANVHDLKSVDQVILSRIQHLDVTKDIVHRSQSAVAYGGFSEVFKGCIRRDGCGVLGVAIKRLRFHTGEEKVMKVRPSLLSWKDLPAHKACPAIRGRSLRMVKVVPLEYFAFARLRYL